jgi:hypothetical protein
VATAKRERGPVSYSKSPWEKGGIEGQPPGSGAGANGNVAKLEAQHGAGL